MRPIPAYLPDRRVHRGAVLAFALVSVPLALTGCGGGEDEVERSLTRSTADNAELARAVGSDVAPGSVSPQDKAELRLGARLSSAELQVAERQAEALDQHPTVQATDREEALPGVVASKSAYTSGQVAAKAAAVRIPAYRFYSGSTGAHFYTTSASERDHVQATLSPPFAYEGSAFSVASTFSPGLSPVHRFFNTQSGVHFYTISEAERANVAANLPQFRYEGVAYHASQVTGAGLAPLYRFYVPSGGFHFYTASVAERNSIQVNLSATYSYEGVGYHVLASDWRAEKLPHTGVTASQCLLVGGGTLVNCSSVAANEFNSQQDGHRATRNPMNYSSVGSFPVSECVYDRVTGLFWEGKTTTGVRAGTHAFTNLGNGLPGDASRYVQDVNALSPCGLSSWRLPTTQELLGLVDYGRVTGPRLNTSWFPNTASEAYWSSDALASDATSAWFVNFNSTGGWSSTYEKNINLHVRLVSGAPPLSQRYSFRTIAYGGDAPGNVVNDAWTGLQWRRCEQGRTWNGSTCTGSATLFNHDQAMVNAQDQSGWRLPNIKELTSIGDLGVASGALVPPAVFPGAVAGFLWSTTPIVEAPSFRKGFNFSTGHVDGDGYGFSHAARLIRSGP